MAATRIVHRSTNHKGSRSLAEVKNKTGRVDVLLHGIASRLLPVIEQRVNLPGLANGLMPIVEKEIRRNVSSSKVIPKEYEELVKVFGEKFKVS